jgi:MoxR-like ATPase
VEVLILMLQNVTLYQTTWYVIPEDVRAVVHDVLRHRIGVTYEKPKILLVDIINKIVNEVEVPCVNSISE